jgi:hypothetical protein
MSPWSGLFAQPTYDLSSPLWNTATIRVRGNTLNKLVFYGAFGRWWLHEQTLERPATS